MVIIDEFKKWLKGIGDDPLDVFVEYPDGKMLSHRSKGIDFKGDVAFFGESPLFFEFKETEECKIAERNSKRFRISFKHPKFKGETAFLSVFVGGIFENSREIIRKYSERFKKLKFYHPDGITDIEGRLIDLEGNSLKVGSFENPTVFWELKMDETLKILDYGENRVAFGAFLDEIPVIAVIFS